MFIFSKNKILKTYKIALGFSPIGLKYKEGDGNTPERKTFLDIRIKTYGLMFPIYSIFLLHKIILN